MLARKDRSRNQVNSYVLSWPKSFGLVEVCGLDERNLHQDVVALALKCGSRIKIYNTADGLKRHQEIKHKKARYKITATLLGQIVRYSILKLVDDKFFLKLERQNLIAIKLSSEEVGALHNEISHILNTYKGNKFRYYNLFFNYFSIDNIFIRKINRFCGTVVALYISIKLLFIVKRDSQSKNIGEIHSEITKNELQGSQYLG